MQKAVERVNELYEIYNCFYASTQGVGKKQLNLIVVPSLSSDFVAQVTMPADVARSRSGYATNDRLLVVFRASEEQEKWKKL